MSQKNENIEFIEALTTIVIFGAIADGNISEEEKDTIVSSIGPTSFFRDYRKSLKQLITSTLVSLLQSPNEALENAINVLPEKFRDTAFALATDVVMCDGTFTPSEKENLILLYEALSIPTMKAQKIMEVMYIKNKGL